MNVLANFMKVGERVIIYCVTHYVVGQVKAVDMGSVVLQPAAWIAGHGRLNASLMKGVAEMQEVEPFPDEVLVNLDSKVLSTKWRHEIPSKPKP